MTNDEKIHLLQESKELINSLFFGDEIGKDKIKKHLEMFIRKNFGDESHYLYDVINNDFADYSWMIIDETTDKNRRIQAWETGKQKMINIIETMIEEIKYFSTESSAPILDPNSKRGFQKIFIVHGHDTEMREATARFVENLGLIPVVLHEQPNLSRTIIEKFENYSDVDYAIVLFSPDDLGKAKYEENLKPRPRQNVVFELGFFLGKLGRTNVVVLHREIDDFEMLSDFQGILFEPYREGWKFRVAKELDAVGFKVDFKNIPK